jgi:competence protein ComEC
LPVPRQLQLEDAHLSDGHVFRFDVRHRDATLIQCPDGQQILVDGGPTPSTVLSRLGRHMPFWDRSLDLVVLTHPEEDHITGLVDVLARYEVGQVLDSGQECDTPTCEAWRKQIEEKHISYQRAEAGMTMELGQAVRLHVLHPPATLLAHTSSDVNNNSMVLRLEWAKRCASTSSTRRQPSSPTPRRTSTTTRWCCAWSTGGFQRC